MFTDQNYKEYFLIIENKEQEMIDFLRGLIPRIQDDTILAVLEFLLSEETRHKKISRDLQMLLD